jgi:two-component system, chemotaxis family, response regulator Rcp1
VGRPKILVIEDNAADIELLRFALDRQGEYELQVLEDGEEALRFIAEHRAGIHDPDPCVILLDVHLPRYDGLEILDALKKAPALQRIQVFVLSSAATREAQAAIQNKGALYRAKPLTLKHFLELGAEIFAVCKDPVLA